MPTAKSTPSPEERVRARAHEIWLREGCPEGRDLVHWRQAEAEIAAESAPAVRQRRPAARATRVRAKAAAE